MVDPISMAINLICYCVEAPITCSPAFRAAWRTRVFLIASANGICLPNKELTTIIFNCLSAFRESEHSRAWSTHIYFSRWAFNCLFYQLWLAVIRAQSTNIITAVCYGDAQTLSHTNFLVLCANTETDNSICEWCFVGCSRCESSCRWGHSKRGLVVIIPHVESGDFAYLTCCCQIIVDTIEVITGYLADFVIVICVYIPILGEQWSTVNVIKGIYRWSLRLGTHNNTDLHRGCGGLCSCCFPANSTWRSIYSETSSATRGAISSRRQWTIGSTGSRSWTVHAKPRMAYWCGATSSKHLTFIVPIPQVRKRDMLEAIEDIDTKAARINTIALGYIILLSLNKYSYSRCITFCGCVKGPVFSLIYLIEVPTIYWCFKSLRATCISRVFLIAKAIAISSNTPNEELTASI